MIKKSSELDALFSKKQSVGNPYFKVSYDLNQEEYTRYAISIGKKYGKAHERNLIKRQIRHIIHLNESFYDYKFKFVVVVKPAASTLNFEQIYTQITELLTKIKNRKGKQHEKMDI